MEHTQEVEMRTRVLPLVALLALVMLLPVSASAGMAGDKELTGQIGYQWGGTQEYPPYAIFPRGGSIHANANMTYGGTLTIYPRDYQAIEFSYHYQGTDLINRPTGLPENKVDDITTQYFLLQGRKDVPTQGKATPFVLGGLGMATFSTLGETNYLFAFGFGAGASIQAGEKMALRLQVRGLIPVQWFTGGVYFGSGGGGVSAGGESSLIQGDASVGLTFKLGQ
jgi:opacity protein-like surface antigen